MFYCCPWRTNIIYGTKCEILFGSKSKGDKNEGFHYGIRVCDNEGILQKYVDNDVVGSYDDHNGINEDNVEDVKEIRVYDIEYNNDVNGNHVHLAKMLAKIIGLRKLLMT